MNTDQANTLLAQVPEGSRRMKTATRYKCDGDHWMIDRTGRRLWCLERECIVHGSGREEF